MTSVIGTTYRKRHPYRICTVEAKRPRLQTVLVSQGFAFEFRRALWQEPEGDFREDEAGAKRQIRSRGSWKKRLCFFFVGSHRNFRWGGERDALSLGPDSCRGLNKKDRGLPARCFSRMHPATLPPRVAAIFKGKILPCGGHASPAMSRFLSPGRVAPQLLPRSTKRIPLVVLMEKMHQAARLSGRKRALIAEQNRPGARDLL